VLKGHSSRSRGLSKVRREICYNWQTNSCTTSDMMAIMPSLSALCNWPITPQRSRSCLYYIREWKVTKYSNYASLHRCIQAFLVLQSKASKARSSNLTKLRHKTYHHCWLNAYTISNLVEMLPCKMSCDKIHEDLVKTSSVESTFKLSYCMWHMANAPVLLYWSCWIMTVNKN